MQPKEIKNVTNNLTTLMGDGKVEKKSIEATHPVG